MKRRQFLGAALALTGGSALCAPRAGAVGANPRSRPGAPGWPTTADWAGLKEAVGGALSPGVAPDLSDPDVRKLATNPFYIGDQPGLTQSAGWLDAWRSSPSSHVVAARNAADIAAAIRFAKVHRLRLVIRGGAHSYFGASNAPDSLMIWTRPMRSVTVHEAFTPKGSTKPPVAAVSAGAGAIWLDAYQAVTTGAGRYVQGGGCTTVGVAGLVQGGGFGSFSKAYGTVAASLLEAEIVTADGQTRVVNAAREPDLFWALKGGGGGVFGVISRVTLATHPLPETVGAVRLTIHARSDEAYRRLIAQFVEVYAKNLCNPHWGEQARVGPDNRLVVAMVFQGLTLQEARQAWAPLIDFANANSTDFEGQNGLIALALPAQHFWDEDFLHTHAPTATTADTRPGATTGAFWWTGDAEQVGAFWHAYTSAWMPADLLKPQNQARLVDAWFAASRHWSVAFHFNKGLAGAPQKALAAARATAMNPDVVEAFALAIIADAGASPYAGLHPDLAGARNRAGRVQAAMTALRTAAPHTGAYVNECDYFQTNWQRAFWGSNYARLARIKRRYDPEGLFFVHHGVGSETWSADGFTPVT